VKKNKLKGMPLLTHIIASSDNMGEGIIVIEIFHQYNSLTD